MKFVHHSSVKPATTVLSWGLQTHHWAAMGALEMAAGQAAQMALILLVTYIGIEPYVRRYFPEALVSWARLLEGRWNDPIVGRDLLVGSLGGIGLLLLRRLAIILPELLHLKPGSQIAGSGTSLGDLPTLAGWFLNRVVDAVDEAFAMLLLLIVLCVVLRKRNLALAALGALLVLGPFLANFTFAEWLAYIPYSALYLWLFLRFGFLVLAIQVLTSTLLLSMPITTDPSRWYATRGFAALAAVFVLATVGFLLAKGKRPFFAQAQDLSYPGGSDEVQRC